MLLPGWWCASGWAAPASRRWSSTRSSHTGRSQVHTALCNVWSHVLQVLHGDKTVPDRAATANVQNRTPAVVCSSGCDRAAMWASAVNGQPDTPAVHAGAAIHGFAVAEHLATVAAAAAADIGAFGPRNYAAEGDAAHSPAVLHNKPDAAAGASSSNQKQQHKQQYEEFELPARLRCALQAHIHVAIHSRTLKHQRIA